MRTGRETLGSIESTIAKLHREESQLDAALRSAVGDSERLRKERAEALRELARVKLDEMAAGRLVEHLDAGERRAAQILDEYRGRIASISERRETLLKEVTKAQAERDAAAKLVETALDAVEALRADVEAKVKALPAWQQAKAANDAVDAVATEAEKKAALSEADLGAKRKPYDDDPLFIYLWRRGFGTGRYNAGNFTRLMDRMVADFIGFGDVRANYAALTEIPLRLREHASVRRAAATEKLTALSEVERRAMLDAGIEPKERALAEARGKLAGADKAVEDRQGALRKLDEERGTLVAAGTNPAYEEALATIALADSKDQLAALYQEARRTPDQRRRCDRAQAGDHRRRSRQGGFGDRRSQAHRPGPGAPPARGGAGARPLPRRGLRSSARHLRQRRRHRRYPQAGPGRRGWRHTVGHPAGRLQRPRPARPAGLRLSHLAVPVPDPRRRQLRPVRRRMARAGLARRLVCRRIRRLGRP